MDATTLVPLITAIAAIIASAVQTISTNRTQAAVKRHEIVGIRKYEAYSNFVKAVTSFTISGEFSRYYECYCVLLPLLSDKVKPEIEKLNNYIVRAASEEEHIRELNEVGMQLQRIARIIGPELSLK